jgi:outer membrane protein assembly factor BamD (BamD/ComL family)
MGSRRRLSKKQLKQDKFVTTTFELAQFTQEHARKTIIGVIIFIALSGSAFYYWNYLSHKENRASRQLSTARVAYESDNFQLAISDLEKFLNEFSGTKHSDEAMLILADTYFQIANYEEARKVLDQFIEDYAGHSPLSFRAYSILGCVLENLNSFEEAAEAYQRAADEARFDYQRVKSRLDAARAFSLAGNNESAIEACRFVLDNHPGAPESGQATLLIAEIEAVESIDLE